MDYISLLNWILELRALLLLAKDSWISAFAFLKRMFSWYIWAHLYKWPQTYHSLIKVLLVLEPRQVCASWSSLQRKCENMSLYHFEELICHPGFFNLCITISELFVLWLCYGREMLPALMCLLLSLQGKITCKQLRHLQSLRGLSTGLSGASQWPEVWVHFSPSRWHIWCRVILEPPGLWTAGLLSGVTWGSGVAWVFSCYLGHAPS